MSPEATKLLAYVEGKLLVQTEEAIFSGVPGTSSDQIAVNYRAALMRRRDLKRIAEAIKDIMGGKEVSEDNDGLTPMDEENARDG